MGLARVLQGSWIVQRFKSMNSTCLLFLLGLGLTTQKGSRLQSVSSNWEVVEKFEVIKEGLDRYNVAEA